MGSATPGQAVLGYIRKQAEPSHGEQASKQCCSLVSASVLALRFFAFLSDGACKL